MSNRFSGLRGWALITAALCGLAIVPPVAAADSDRRGSRSIVDTAEIDTGGPEVGTTADGSLSVSVDRDGELDIRAAYRNIVIDTSPDTPTQRRYRLVVRVDGRVVASTSATLTDGRSARLTVRDEVRARGANIVSAALLVRENGSSEFSTIDSSLGISLRGASTAIQPDDTDPDTAYAVVPLDPPYSGTLEAFGERERNTGSNVAVTVRVTSTSDTAATFTFMIQPDQTVRRTVTVRPNSTTVIRFPLTANGPTRVENVTVWPTDAEGVSVASPLDLLFFE